jgi:hypothetical protein
MTRPIARVDEAAGEAGDDAEHGPIDHGDDRSRQGDGQREGGPEHQPREDVTADAGLDAERVRR